jgi:hypothetical protein
MGQTCIRKGSRREARKATSMCAYENSGVRRIDSQRGENILMNHETRLLVNVADTMIPSSCPHSSHRNHCRRGTRQRMNSHSEEN